MSKGILSKIKLVPKEEVVHVQVAVPRELYEDVARVLESHKPKISWQKALIASIESIKEEAKKNR